MRPRDVSITPGFITSVEKVNNWDYKASNWNVKSKHAGNVEKVSEFGSDPNANQQWEDLKTP